MANRFRDDNYYSENESNSKRTNSMSRPSGKSIYHQRKSYTEAVIKQQHECQHRVEHLLTSYIDGKDIRNAANCIDRLKMMDAQGQVWGQGMFLQVKDQKLLLTDIEAEEELDSYSLDWIQDCACFLGSCNYNSILAITVKEPNLRRTSILLFQCEEIGAELLKTKLEKIIEESRQNHDMLRSNLENILYQQNQASFNGKAPMAPYPTSPTEAHSKRQEQHHWKDNAFYMDHNTGANGQQKQKNERAWEDPWSPLMMQDLDRNIEILNHVLGDIEIFAEKLKKSSGSLKNTKKRLKKKKNEMNKDKIKKQLQKEKAEEKGKLEPTMNQPSAPELVQLIFSTLSSGGISRGTIRPPYKPTFSDGWEPPMPTQRQGTMDFDKAQNGNKNGFSDRVSNPPQLMQAMYEFHARNSRELNVTKGDLLEVLDQRKKWWLARNSAGEEGYIPNNILEPTDQMAPKGNYTEQVSRDISDLNARSSPAEVTVWLRTNGFSKITVKSLGILNGLQLLSMSQDELKTVCPEEGKRVFLKLRQLNQH